MVVADTIPRYAQPMDAEPVGPFCGGCATYKEMSRREKSDGRLHYVGGCVFEVFMAKTLDELATAELIARDPEDEACEDFRRADGA